jgi:hypothetical protein
MSEGGESPFPNEEGERVLVDCAVLYLDMLGVGAMAQGAQAQKELHRFERAIRSAFRFELGTMGSGDDAIVAAVFSDSFVAAAQAEEGFTDPRAEAIANLVFEAASIQGVLALNNYFVRGAITLGQCHFHRGLIFGPALVEAVGLERRTAVDPRIVLSPGAVEALRQGRGESIGREAIRVDEDGLAFIDYLDLLYQDPSVTARSNLVKHRRVVEKNLEGHATDVRRWRKHRWVAEYHNDFVRRREDELIENRVDPEQLRIDVVDGNRRLRPVNAIGIERSRDDHESGPPTREG